MSEKAREDDGGTRRLRVLRIFHSGVVAAWRAREEHLRDLGLEVALVAPERWDEGGAVVELAGATGLPEGVVPARTVGRHPYLFLYDPRPLWRELGRRDLDVVDVQEEPAALATAEVLLLACLRGHRRTPVVLYSAQNIEKRYPPPFRWLERLALRRAAAVYTCNDDAGRILRRKGFRGIVGNFGLGVDTDRFSPVSASPSAPGGSHEPVRLGYVGRLEAHKGVTVLLDALARVDGVSLKVVGDGPERERVAGEIRRLRLDGRVELTGFSSADALPDVYRSFDLLAVPSLDTPSWIEQFGRVAVEAMACGVPVVASDSGSLPEVVGEAGALVPPGDPLALAEAIERLRDDPEERRRLGEAGRRRALRYSWAAIAERQAELYREVLG